MKKKIKVRLHPNSSQDKIIELEENSYEVWLGEKPIEGKANRALEKVLKKHFKVGCQVISGLTSRNKTIELDMSRA